MAGAFFERLWRTDRFLPLGLLGVIVAMGASFQLETHPGQAFEVFFSRNSGSLGACFLGIAAFFVSCLSAPAQCARLAESEALVTRSKSPSTRWPAIIAMSSITLGAAAFAYTIYDTIKAPMGMDGPFGLVLALGLLLLGCAVFEGRRRRRGWFEDLSSARPQQALPLWKRDTPWLLLVLAFWTAAQVQNLDTEPGYFHGDESMHVNYGRQVYSERTATPWEQNALAPYLPCVPRAVFDDLFPARPYFGSRLFGVLVGTLMLSVFFFLARVRLGRLAAWVTLILLGSNILFLHAARSAFVVLDASVILATGTLTFLAAWRSQRFSMGLLAGFLLGGTRYFYYASLLLAPVILATLAVQLVRAPRSLSRRKWILIAVILGYALASTPYHLYAQGKNLDARLGRVSILSSPHLSRLYERYEVGTVPEVLLHHSWPAVGGALLWPEPRAKLGSGKFPISDRGASALFLLGAVGAVALWRRHLLLLLAGLWWIGAVTGAGLTSGAPNGPRLTLSLGPGYLLASWVLTGLVGRAHRVGRRFGLALLMVALAWTGATAWENMRRYYVDELGDRSAMQYRRSDKGIMEFMRVFPEDAHMIYYGRGTKTSSLQMFNKGVIQHHFMKEDAKLIDPGETTAYVFERGQYRDLEEELKERYPRARSLRIFNPFLEESPPTHHVYWIDR